MQEGIFDGVYNDVPADSASIGGYFCEEQGEMIMIRREDSAGNTPFYNE